MRNLRETIEVVKGLVSEIEVAAEAIGALEDRIAAMERSRLTYREPMSVPNFPKILRDMGMTPPETKR